MPQINIYDLESGNFELHDNTIVCLNDDEAAQVYGGGRLGQVGGVIGFISNAITIGQVVGSAISSSNGSSAFNGSTSYDALGNVTGGGGSSKFYSAERSSL
ncbi:MAG: hypothetical protein HWQ35_07945 [Nostoc sp. NMS1]|uniref:hypothetical protein n=1 Tax=Nostoc sp. NMS1 TaxID=2815388 RepID=UPI0025F938F8|nr:hypothetical protein [Nostoc sp. NMS1]MBN3906481.1 hypothetical protein [Nostoc sp. NMS1]